MLARSHLTPSPTFVYHPSGLDMQHTPTDIDNLQPGDCIYTPISIAKVDVITQDSTFSGDTVREIFRIYNFEF